MKRICKWNIPRPLAAVPKKPFCWLFWSDMVDVCVCVCYISRGDSESD
jgi:hypothetical protein